MKSQNRSKTGDAFNGAKGRDPVFCLSQLSDRIKQSLHFPGFLIRTLFPRYFKGADLLIAFPL